MDATFIESVRTENTGGNIMVDFITLKDGHIITVSDGVIGLYQNMNHFENNEDPTGFIDLF